MKLFAKEGPHFISSVDLVLNLCTDYIYHAMFAYAIPQPYALINVQLPVLLLESSFRLMSLNVFDMCNWSFVCAIIAWCKQGLFGVSKDFLV